MAAKEPEVSVTVIRRREITTYPTIGVAKVSVLVTYVAAGLPPWTVTIAKEEYSLEKEKAEIRASIQERLMAAPESYKV